MKAPKPLKRSRPPRRKGGSRFPRRRDPAYMAWLLSLLLSGVPCDAECGRRAGVRAHLDAKGSGGWDVDNVALLCLWCHGHQEKRTRQFIVECGVDLYAKARAHTARYQGEPFVEEATL